MSHESAVESFDGSDRVGFGERMQLHELLQEEQLPGSPAGPSELLRRPDDATGWRFGACRHVLPSAAVKTRQGRRAERITAKRIIRRPG